MSTAHNDMVAKLVAEKGAETHRFQARMMELMTSRSSYEDEEERLEAIECFKDELRGAKVIPDAFVITNEGGGSDWPEVDVYEVVDTHKLSDDKLQRYGWWADLSETPRINLYVISVHGVVLEYFTCNDLMPFAFGPLYGSFSEMRKEVADYRVNSGVRHD